MFGLLEGVWHALAELPFLLVGLLVGVLNGLIAGVASLAQALLSVLPSFPSVPAAPSGIMGAVLWAFPLGTLAAVWMSFVGLWVTFLGVRFALKKVGLL